MTTTSYSQSNTYISCPQHWKLKYIDKWEGPEEGAALSFGTAFDAGVSALLLKNDNYHQVFSEKFFSSVNRKKEIVPIFDSKVISYGEKDFDEYVLKQEDRDTLKQWAIDLKVNVADQSGVDIFKAIAKTKKNPYKKVSETQMQFYNRASWLSLKRKGEILLEAFKTQFLPQVEEVLVVQKHAYLKDEGTGDAVTGYIDFILRIKGHKKPIIFDLKTAASLYKQEQIDNTDQLTLYAAIEGHRYGTDMVGYVVCVKNIKKDNVSYCKVCNHRKVGQFKTCNNVLAKPHDKAGEILYENERCGGEWEEKIELQPEVQVLVEQKSETQMRGILLDQANIIEGMKQEIVYKNTSKCTNWYGSKCIYYDLCHKNDPKGLKKKGS